MTDAGARIYAALERTGSDGAPLYSDDVVGDVLALLLLGAGAEELDPIAAHLVVTFAQRAGIAPGADGAQVGAAVRAYLTTRPLPPELATELQQAVRELLTEASPGAERAARALGEARGALEHVPVAARVPAAGAQRMGVLGRFGLDVKKPPG